MHIEEGQAGLVLNAIADLIQPIVPFSLRHDRFDSRASQFYLDYGYDYVQNQKRLQQSTDGGLK